MTQRRIIYFKKWTFPSESPATADRLSGLNAQLYSGASAYQHAICCAFCIFHSLNVLSSETLIPTSPSGLNEQSRTLPVWPVKLRRNSPLSTSHKRSVPSSEALSACLPLGLNTQAFTMPIGPLNIRDTCQPGVVLPRASCLSTALIDKIRVLRASHSRSVPSAEALSICWPSGLKAQAVTAPLCPANLINGRASCIESRIFCRSRTSRR
jgi:hypothetical protein